MFTVVKSIYGSCHTVDEGLLLTQINSLNQRLRVNPYALTWLKHMGVAGASNAAWECSPANTHTIMNKYMLAAAAGAALVSGAAMAQDFKEGDWLVRARVVHLDATNKNSNPAVPVSIDNKTLPEVDFSYFFSKNLAAELILTVPQKQKVFLGANQIGSLKHLPPTLTLQYHFDAPGFKPYVGAGINYTRFSSVNLPAGLDIKRNSWGGALQVGVDIPVAKDLYFNIDVKKVFIKTDVRQDGAKIDTFKVDPLLVGVGLGWKF